MRGMASTAAAAFIFAIASPAAAQVTLLDRTNIPAQVSTPSSTLGASQSFTATSTSSVLTIGGYDVPGAFVLANIRLATSAAPTVNVLGEHFTYTPAAVSPLASEGNLGIYGTRDLSFRGGDVGSYDTFTQTFNTTVGTTYNLSYLFTLTTCRGCSAVPNGLRITAGEPTVAGVPEPSTWAMMLLGFGGVGYAMRRGRKAALAV